MPHAAKKFKSARERVLGTDLRVRDLMSQPVVCLTRDNSLEDAEKLMQRKNIRHVPVVDEHHQVVGLISHRDILRYSLSELAEVSQLDRNILISEICIGELMHQEIMTITPSTTLRTAAFMMAEKKYGCLPVTEDGKLVGIITEGDFLNFFANGY